VTDITEISTEAKTHMHKCGLKM